MICMKNLRFSSRLRAKVRCQGPPGSARAQPCRSEGMCCSSCIHYTMKAQTSCPYHYWGAGEWQHPDLANQIIFTVGPCNPNSIHDLLPIICQWLEGFDLIQSYPGFCDPPSGGDGSMSIEKQHTQGEWGNGGGGGGLWGLGLRELT